MGVAYPVYPPSPDSITRYTIELDTTFGDPQTEPYRLPLPKEVQQVWGRAVARGIPARKLELYRAGVRDVIADELSDSDGFCNPTTGYVILLADSADSVALIRVLLHELAHLVHPASPPMTIDAWYAVEVETTQAVATLARQLGVSDPGLGAVLKAERRSLATQYRWLGGAARAAGSSRLAVASAVLAQHRGISGLLGHSERTARAEIGLRAGHRLWLLDLPRSSLRRFWQPGDTDPLFALHPLPSLEGDDDDEIWDENEPIGSDSDSEAEPIDSDDNADERDAAEAEATRLPEQDDADRQFLAPDSHYSEEAIWAIDPDDPIFGRGDDRDDDEMATQLHTRSAFAFGDAWNYLVSDRRRASLLAALLGRMLALPPLPWTIITTETEALAIAYVFVADEGDLVAALGYLQGVLLDQHVDAHAAAVWSLYTTGDDPTCDHAWYRLRVTFTGEVAADWPSVSEVWLFLWDDYPGFHIAALQSYMDGWSKSTTLCPIQWPVDIHQPPSQILAHDTRMAVALRTALGDWLDQRHTEAFGKMGSGTRDEGEMGIGGGA